MVRKGKPKPRQWLDPDEPAPWPVITAKAAGKLLNVDTQVITHLISEGQVRGCCTLAKSNGGWIWLANKEDVDGLHARMTEG